MDNGRCRLHGGLSPSGMAAGPFKTGRYSKYLPVRLRDAYEESLSNPDMLRQRNEIALCDARIQELVSMIDTGSSAQRCAEIREGWDKVSEARRKGKGLVEALTAVETLSRRQSDSEGIWIELSGILDQRRKLIESEAKLILQAQSTLNAEQALGLATAMAYEVGQAIKDIVDDPAIRQRLLREIGYRTRRYLSSGVSETEEVDSDEGDYAEGDPGNGSMDRALESGNSGGVRLL